MTPTNKFFGTALLLMATVLAASMSEVAQARYKCGKAACTTETKGDQTCKVCKTPLCEKRDGKEFLVGQEVTKTCETTAKSGQPLSTLPTAPLSPTQPAKPATPTPIVPATSATPQPSAPKNIGALPSAKQPQAPTVGAQPIPKVPATMARDAKGDWGCACTGARGAKGDCDAHIENRFGTITIGCKPAEKNGCTGVCSGWVGKEREQSILY